MNEQEKILIEINKELIKLLKESDDTYRDFRIRLMQISNKIERLQNSINKN